MELRSHLYFRHTNANVMYQLDALWQQHLGQIDLFKQYACALNPIKGEQLALALIEQVNQIEYDLAPESLYRFADYSIMHFVHGSDGAEIIEEILTFLKSLVPQLHLQAWGCGDDDPWEFWFKFEGEHLIRQDDEPLNDADEDQQIKASIYAWWHKDMPVEIKAGFLNEAQYQDNEA